MSDGLVARSTTPRPGNLKGCFTSHERLEAVPIPRAHGTAPVLTPCTGVISLCSPLWALIFFTLNPAISLRNSSAWLKITASALLSQGNNSKPFLLSFGFASVQIFGQRKFEADEPTTEYLLGSALRTLRWLGDSSNGPVHFALLGFVYDQYVDDWGRANSFSPPCVFHSPYFHSTCGPFSPYGNGFSNIPIQVEYKGLFSQYDVTFKHCLAPRNLVCYIQAFSWNQDLSNQLSKLNETDLKCTIEFSDPSQLCVSLDPSVEWIILFSIVLSAFLVLVFISLRRMIKKLYWVFTKLKDAEDTKLKDAEYENRRKTPNITNYVKFDDDEEAKKSHQISVSFSNPDWMEEAKKFTICVKSKKHLVKEELGVFVYSHLKTKIEELNQLCAEPASDERFATEGENSRKTRALEKIKKQSWIWLDLQDSEVEDPDLYADIVVLRTIESLARHIQLEPKRICHVFHHVLKSKKDSVFFLDLCELYIVEDNVSFSNQHWKMEDEPKMDFKISVKSRKRAKPELKILIKSHLTTQMHRLNVQLHAEAMAIAANEMRSAALKFKQLEEDVTIAKANAEEAKRGKAGVTDRERTAEEEYQKAIVQYVDNKRSTAVTENIEIAKDKEKEAETAKLTATRERDQAMRIAALMFERKVAGVRDSEKIAEAEAILEDAKAKIIEDAKIALAAAESRANAAKEMFSAGFRYMELEEIIAKAKGDAEEAPSVEFLRDPEKIAEAEAKAIAVKQVMDNATKEKMDLQLTTISSEEPWIKEAALKVIHYKAREGYYAWLMFPKRPLSDSELLNLDRHFPVTYGKDVDWFADVVVLRTVESLAEHILHAPERISAVYQGVLESYKDREFFLDLCELHTGLDEIHSNGDPYTNINFDDINDAGLLNEPPERKYWLESKGPLVLIDICRNFSTILYVKLWVFFIMHSFFNEFASSVFWLATADATLFTIMTLGFEGLYTGMYQNKGSPWLPKQYARYKILLGLFGFGACAFFFCFAFAEMKPWLFGVSLAWLILRLVYASLLHFFFSWHKPTAAPRSSPLKDNMKKDDNWKTDLTWGEEERPWTPAWRSYRDIDIEQEQRYMIAGRFRLSGIGAIIQRYSGAALNRLLWAVALFLTAFWEVYSLIPMATDTNVHTLCKPECLVGQQFVNVFYFFTLTGTRCKACYLSNAVLWTVITLTIMLDIYLVFYLMSGIVGYVLGMYRGLENAQNSHNLNFKKDAKMLRKLFGDKFNVLFNQMIDTLHDECLISHDLKTKLKKHALTDHRPELFQNMTEVVKRRLSFWLNTCVKIAKDIGPTSKYKFGESLDKSKLGSIPFLTQLIPVFDENIVLTESFLRKNGAGMDGDTNLSFIISQYPEEWKLCAALCKCSAEDLYPKFMCGTLKPDDVERVCLFCSYRMQTVVRTVQGAVYYHKMLQTYFTQEHAAAHAQLLIAHQTYGSIQKDPVKIQELDDAEKSIHWMLRKWQDVPIDVCVSYDGGNVKESFRKKVRGYLESRFTEKDAIESCLKGFASVILRYSSAVDDCCVVEVLPRCYPLRIGKKKKISQGKSANQKHALLFCKGAVLQIMDANMGAFFGEAAKVPFVLREGFNNSKDRRLVNYRILGFRETIFTERHGAVGASMAGSEWTFGTIFQRFLTFLSVRLHYGHPDFIDCFWASNRGSVSKASALLNLSEDVFSGFNCHLRGAVSGHSDLLQWEKGREVDFIAASVFFTKISSGAGTMLRSRDIFLVCNTISGVRVFSFFYGLIGFYCTHFLAFFAVNTYVLFFFVLSLASINLQKIASLNSAIASNWIIPVGLVALLPQAFELILEYGPVQAIVILASRIIPSSVFFVFQNVAVSHAFSSACQTGLATYLSTGRPNANQSNSWLKNFRHYALSHYYPALFLALVIILIRCMMESDSGALAMTSVILVVSILMFAPIIFSPLPCVATLQSNLSEYFNFVFETPRDFQTDVKEPDKASDLYTFWLCHYYDMHKPVKDWPTLVLKVLQIIKEASIVVVFSSCVHTTVIDIIVFGISAYLVIYILICIIWQYTNKSNLFQGCLLLLWPIMCLFPDTISGMMGKTFYVNYVDVALAVLLLTYISSSFECTVLALTDRYQLLSVPHPAFFQSW